MATDCAKKLHQPAIDKHTVEKHVEKAIKCLLGLVELASTEDHAVTPKLEAAARILLAELLIAYTDNNDEAEYHIQCAFNLSLNVKTTVVSLIFSWRTDTMFALDSSICRYRWTFAWIG